MKIFLLIALFISFNALAGVKKPVAILKANPVSGYLPLSVEFIGSDSYDPDGQITSYAWSFGDGATSQLSDVTHVYLTSKKEKVKLTVTDNDGKKAEEKIAIDILADTTAPTLNFDVPDSSIVRIATPAITAFYSDSTSKVDISKIIVLLDNEDVTSHVSISTSHAVVQFTTEWPLTPGVHTLKVIVSDYYGNLASKTIIVNFQAQNITNHYLNGKVLSIDGLPVANAQVMSVNGPEKSNLLTYTRADGTFSLPFISGGQYQIQISKAGFLDIFKYKTLRTGFDDVLDTVTIAEADTKKTFIAAVAGGSATNTSGSISIVIPPGSLDSDKQLYFTEAVTGKTLQVPLPGGSQFTYAQNNQPSGTTFSTAADIAINNILGFPAGFEIPVGVTDESMGVWVDSGYKGIVSTDEEKINFKVDHFSDFDVNLNTTAPDGEDQESSEPEDSDEAANCSDCKKNPKEGGSRVNAISGQLHIDYKLPGVMRRGKDVSLGLSYSSLNASPMPIVTVRSKDLYKINPPTLVEVVTNYAGFSKTKLYEGKAAIGASSFAEPFQLKSPEGYTYGTGTFGYSVLIRSKYENRYYASTAYFGGPALPQSSDVETREPVYLEEFQDGKATHLANTYSRYGSGWTINGQERLHIQGDGILTFEDGRGDSSYFMPAGTVATKKLVQKRVGDRLANLHYSKGFFYGASCESNEVFKVDLKGRFTTILSNTTHKNLDLNCPTSVFQSRKGGFYITDTGNKRILYLGKDLKVKTVAGGNTKSRLDNPTYVTEDNVLAVHFIDGNDVKTISPFNGEVIPLIGTSADAPYQYDLKKPTQIIYDEKFNFMVLDEEAGKVIKFYISGGNSRVILDKIEGINTLAFDNNLKRYFALDKKGQIHHWEGQGHKRILQMDVSGKSIKVFAGSEKEKAKLPNVSTIAFSPEIGLVYATENGLNLHPIDHSKSSPEDLYYISYAGDFSRLVKLPDESFVKTEVDKTITKYNAAGFITEKIYVDGTQYSYIYGLNNQLLKINIPGGGFYGLEYHGWGNLSRIIDPTGKSTEFSYDSNGNLTEIKNPELNSNIYTYDANHLLTSHTDERGLTSNYEYKLNRVTRISLPGGRTKTFNNALFESLLTTPQDGIYPRISPFDAKVDITSPAGRLKSYIIDAFGSFKGFIDGNGFRSYVDRDLSAQPIQTTSAEGRKEFTRYDSQGRVTRTNNASGVLLYGYSASSNKLTRIQDAFNFSENFLYNPQGQLSVYIDKKNIYTNFTYNADGTLNNISDFLNNTTIYGRDEYGNVISIKDMTGQLFTMTRDDSGNLKTQSDPLGNQTSFNYDEMNRVTSITDAKNGETSFGYLPTGELETVNDARGHTTTFVYNDQTEVSQIINHLNQSTHFSHDEDGNITNKTTRKGHQLNYVYDANNVLTRKVTDETINYVYDRDSLLTEMSDADSIVSRSYDLFARLENETSNHYDGSITWGYNERGENDLTTLTINNQAAIKTQKYFDPNGRLQKQTSSFFGRDITFQKTFDALGRVTNLVYPNGSQSTFHYDANSRPVDMSTNIPGVHYMDYRYTANGNISTVYEEYNLVSRPNRYEYDELSRLVKEQTIKNQSYVYDSVGNDSNNGGTFNELNQLLEDSNYLYQYDLNGNQTKKTNKVTQARHDFTWDREDKLVKVMVYNNATVLSKTISYKYDASGRRIFRSVLNHIEASKSYTRKFIYDGDQIIAVLDENNNFVAGYMYDEGIDEPVVLVTDYDTDGNLDTLSIVRDRQNSVKLLVNEKKEIVQEMAYSAYGETQILNRGQKNPKTNNNFLYTSRELEPELGIYYYRARYYDPGTGRFLSEDPIGFNSEQVNFYRYTFSSPINNTDPSGLYTYSKTAGDPINSYMEGSMQCMDECMGMTLVISGAKEKGHHGGKTGPHATGNACDISKKQNPTITTEEVKMCYNECFDSGKSYAQEEKTHYHIQWKPGLGNATGFAKGIK